MLIPIESGLENLSKVSFMLNWNLKLIGALISASIIVITVAISSFIVKDDKKDAFINLTVLVFGWAVGWLLGTFLSPYTGAEKLQFAEYAGAISVFVSGYAIGKVDRLITHILTPDNFFSVSRVTGFRIIVFSVVLIVAMIVTFVFRRYA
jgi:hypothetical protein